MATALVVGLLLVLSACAEPVSHPFPVETIAVDETTLDVWVADNPEDRRQGLMEIDQLPKSIDGMLFVFEETRRTSFWMLNTLIPLDVWWFDGDGVLLGSTFMEPCPAEPCTSYPAPGAIRWALETPAGEFNFPVGAVLVP